MAGMQIGKGNVCGDNCVGEVFGAKLSQENALGIVWGNFGEGINQSINTFITRHGTEARATVRITPEQREMS